MRRNIKLCCCFIAAMAAGSGQGPAVRSLKDQFKNPPREYSMEPLWSWNGALERDKLVWQIDQMVDKGVYGAYMHTRDGLDQSATPYFSDAFWDAVKTSVEHSSKVGFRAWMYDEDKWPSGDAGGRTRAVNPERYTAAGIWPRIESVRGGSRVRLEHKLAKAVVAARETANARIDPDSLADLTDINVRGGEWQAPDGEWKLFVFEPVRRPVPLPNYLNPDAVKEFLNNTYEEYAKRVSSHFGKTIPGSFFDEIFNITLAWDPLLEERFRREKGYELRQVLPLLFAEAGPRAIKVRCDYFDVFTKQYEEAWFKQISEWCARHNLKLTGHTNEELHAILDQGDYFRTWRHPQMPGTDNEDFRYTFPRVVGSWKPKQLSSVAHMYGRDRAMVEALGGAGWTITLDEARYGVNMLAAYGMNSFVMHLFHYTQDAVESMDDWPNSWFYQNPYWKYFKKFADYTTRVSFMGSQGEHVAAVAVLYPVEEVWSHVLQRGPRQPAAVVQLTEALVREHIDFDLVDTDTLIRAQPVTGGAKIGSESYRVLILPDTETVSARAYSRLAELAGKGLKVIALGRVPKHSAEKGADDPDVANASAALFGTPSATAADVPAAIARVRQIAPADVRIVSGDAAALRYYHRRVQDRDIYFLANSERTPLSARVRFASSGRPERWDAETGETSPLPVASRDAGATLLDIEMRPWQAYFVVFDRSAAPARIAAAPKVLSTVDLKGPWTFHVAPTELDYVWKEDPGETKVEVPVADFRLERAGEDRAWRRVKLTDALSKVQGAARYLSAWDAFWITRYDYNRNHPGVLAGPDLRFTREITLASEPASSKLIVVADGAAECLWNGRRIAQSTEPLKPMVIEKVPAVRGSNRIEIVVRGAGYLLVEGDIRDGSGRMTRIRSDKGWHVAAPAGPAAAAFEFAAPPFGKWGEPDRGAPAPLVPATVAYRVPVPPGAKSIDPPEVKGKYEISVDGVGLRGAALPAKATALTIRVQLDSISEGLMKPVVFRCTKAAAALGDWNKTGLDWYSGRAIYTTTFTAPALANGARLTLDLGAMHYTGEVWINGTLVDTLAWEPYNLDITKAVKPGTNRLTVIVANLSANEMRWNIFDAAMSRPVSRWWHDGNILREEHKLRSGLIGPVRLIVSR